MNYCTLEMCMHPKTKEHQCYTKTGKRCEKSNFGCPKCHGTNISQSENGYWLLCNTCNYSEFDD